MDNPSIDYYNQNADRFYQNTAFADMSALYGMFEQYLPAHARILDAGCGSGRDSLHFAQKGYAVTAFDAAHELVLRARALTSLPVRECTFESFEDEGLFDGIWACASLLHVSREQTPATLRKLAGFLKPGGVFYLSFKVGSGEAFRNGRMFNDYDEDSFRTMIADLPELTVVELQMTDDVRPEIHERWLNVVMKKG